MNRRVSVHRGEYVMPKNVVDSVGVDYMQKVHRELARYSNGGYVSSPSYSMADLSPMLSEMRALRNDVRSLQLQVNVFNPISLGDGLKVEIPKYDKFKNNKYPDSQ